jgi:hypothetical protein
MRPKRMLIRVWFNLEFDIKCVSLAFEHVECKTNHMCSYDWNKVNKILNSSVKIGWIKIMWGESY